MTRPAPARRFRVSWGPLLLALFLAGCAAAPQRPVPPDVEVAWQARRALMGEVTRWHLMASLAVRTENDGGQANLDWHQREGAYEIRLSGPLGSGAARLTGDGSHATLLLANGRRLSDPSAAQLLYDEFGWWLPVDSLRYWAVGLPDPALPARWSLDPWGRLASLEQNGWAVTFDTYRPAGELELPERVTISGHEAEVRVVARRWSLDSGEAR
jgi:outer membrane lipoprotein LolB